MELNQKVRVKHQPEIVGTVVNHHDPTDMVRLDGTPVGHYVRVKIDKGDVLGYHEYSLEAA